MPVESTAMDILMVSFENVETLPSAKIHFNFKFEGKHNSQFPENHRQRKRQRLCFEKKTPTKQRPQNETRSGEKEKNERSNTKHVSKTRVHVTSSLSDTFHGFLQPVLNIHEHEMKRDISRSRSKPNSHTHSLRLLQYTTLGAKTNESTKVASDCQRVNKWILLGRKASGRLTRSGRPTDKCTRIKNILESTRILWTSFKVLRETAKETEQIHGFAHEYK